MGIKSTGVFVVGYDAFSVSPASNMLLVANELIGAQVSLL